jgi:CHAD domain-containing protein
VRELDVALETLDAFGAEVPRAAVTHLRQVLRQERRRLYAAMSREVTGVNVDKLRRRALGAARKTRAVNTAARAARRAVRLRSAIESAGSMYLPDRLHDVRIAVKKLRYALELGRSAGHSRASTRLRTLKAVQDLLGRMHDLEVLIARVRAVQGAPAAPTLSLSADLDRLVRRLETECRQLHGYYMSLRKALLTVCRHVAAVPARHERQARLSPAA